MFGLQHFQRRGMPWWGKQVVEFGEYGVVERKLQRGEIFFEMLARGCLGDGDHAVLAQQPGECKLCRGNSVLRRQIASARLSQ